MTYISRDAQGHLANLNAGPLALRVRLYHRRPPEPPKDLKIRLNPSGTRPLAAPQEETLETAAVEEVEAVAAEVAAEELAQQTNK